MLKIDIENSLRNKLNNVDKNKELEAKRRLQLTNLYSKLGKSKCEMYDKMVFI